MTPDETKHRSAEALEAMKFVNSGLGKKLRLRGINARVVDSGTFAVGDMLRKLDSAQPT